MDWKKAGNIASVGMFILTIPLLLLTAAMLAFMVWVRTYPDPAQAPTIQGEALMNGYGWGPPIFLGSLLLLTVILHALTASRTRKGKPSNADATTEPEEVQRLKAELLQAQTDAQTLRERFAGKSEQKKSLERERDKCLSELTEAKQQIEGLKVELAESVGNAKEANLRADDQRNQKDNIYTLFKDCERQVANLAWLRRMAEEQAKDIAEHVVITKVKPGSLILNNSPRCITLGLRIRNESIFDITIRPTNVTGHLFFQTRRLNDPARVLIDTDRPPIENLKPMQREILVLEQPLLQSEAESINEARQDVTARFWLGNLSIPISVENVSQQVPAQNLRIRAEVEHVLLSDFA